jgi:hypothetical protein
MAMIYEPSTIRSPKLRHPSRQVLLYNGQLPGVLVASVNVGAVAEQFFGVVKFLQLVGLLGAAQGGVG